MKFHRNILDIDVAQESERIEQAIRETVLRQFKRRGVVIGVSGGVDSSAVLALAVRALGPKRVFALTMPEKESSGDSEQLAIELTQKFGVELVKEDLTDTLTAAGCYVKRDMAVRQLFSNYDPAQHGVKITLPGDLLENKSSLNVFSLVMTDETGEEHGRLMPPKIFLEVVASSNFKQRTRMMTLYYHAEKRNYAVIGTANKDEHKQGFFVKYGDGGVDLQPIQHLFKTQVFQLAAHVGVPQSIIDRTPTTDTYSAGSSQEEFFFRLPFELMDPIWYGLEHDVPAEDVAAAFDLTPQQVENVYRELRQKIRTTEYLRAAPTMLSSPK
ncbi:MAG: NAD(+) synthase [Chloroflexi bacterium]|nr:NAD(+) synthase [Chloroflexota bacterium]